MKIARIFTFEAAHTLPYHDGPCQRLHGHSYRLELIFSGPVRAIHPKNPQSGFITDFGRIQKQVEEHLIQPYLDHHDLSQSISELPYPSAEYLAAWIMGWCMKNLDDHPDMGQAKIHAAILWETQRSWAKAKRKDAKKLGFFVA
ncbi:6-pyruvoyl trahydropterin synthase family protein [Magnetococcales bacterium HHB-1]